MHEHSVKQIRRISYANNSESGSTSDGDKDEKYGHLENLYCSTLPKYYYSQIKMVH